MLDFICLFVSFMNLFLCVVCVYCLFILICFQFMLLLLLMILYIYIFIIYTKMMRYCRENGGLHGTSRMAIGGVRIRVPFCRARAPFANDRPAFPNPVAIDYPRVMQFSGNLQNGSAAPFGALSEASSASRPTPTPAQALGTVF